MRCPSGCDAALLMAERLGVEVDYCPNCRGVWLDRGELDKLLERATAPTMSAPPPPSAPPPSRGYERYDERYDTRYPTSGHKKKSKKKHLLEELFDF